jgi:ribosomal protein S18 acetylase RimI-like enzyme
MKFRRATAADYKLITEVHFKAFEGFFLSSLGKSFMQTYYRTAILHVNTLCVCAVNDNEEICGFVLGSLVSAGFNKSIILTNKLAYTWEGLKIAVTRPKALLRLKYNLNKRQPSNGDDGQYAEVALIGVAPDFQGKGVGRQLFKEFEIQAKLRGVSKICLTTDYYDNSAVLAYNAWGLAEWYTYIAYPNRKMYKMFKEV